MKKIDLYTFMKGLKKTDFIHPRSTYTVNKNKRQIKEIIEDMEKAIKPNEKMEEYMKEREELAKTHSEKDENDKPKMEKKKGLEPETFQMVYVIIGQDNEKSAYGKELAKLNKRFDEEIKAQDEKLKKYNDEFLIETTEYEVFMIDLSFLEAHETCPQPVMDLIWWMVRDDMNTVDLKDKK